MAAAKADPWAERYNRRTRALERLASVEAYKADSLDRIAAALELQALATAAATKAPTADGLGRVWTETFAAKIQGAVASAAEKIGRFK